MKSGAYLARTQPPLQRYGGLGVIMLFHVLAVYALVTGLAHRMIDAIRHPLDIKIVDEIKPPPRPEIKPAAPQAEPAAAFHSPA